MKDKSYPSLNNKYRKEFELFFKLKIKKDKINEFLVLNDNDFKIEDFKWLRECFAQTTNKKYDIKHYIIKKDCSQ